MYKYTILFILLFYIELSTQNQERPIANPENEGDSEKIMIIATKIELNNENLNINYEIRNNSQQEIWICDNIAAFPVSFADYEVFIDEDDQTLVVRKRMDVPSSILYTINPAGKYIRLCPGNKKSYSLLFPLPVHYTRVYKGIERREGIVYATRIAIEIGYYVGNLPELYYSGAIETAGKYRDIDRALRSTGGNEKLRQRNEEVIIPHAYWRLKGEKVLHTIIENQRIPYTSQEDRLELDPPDLTNCTYVKIQYEPSMLEYFYPYQSQQDLFSNEEIQYLKSEKTIILKETKTIKDLADEIIKTKRSSGSGIVSNEYKACVLGYHNSSRTTSFVVYDDRTIETEQKRRIRYSKYLQSLKSQTLQIQPFELRLQCAANMRNLWYRMRVYEKAIKRNIDITEPTFVNVKRDKIKKDMQNIKDDFLNEVYTNMENVLKRLRLYYESAEKRRKELNSNKDFIYPIPSDWCDTMEVAYYKDNMKIHICPSAKKGKCNYAMNPNCEPNSPGDMVLLFETKAGWNQHGGPELFTFDNHDPRGGCVLLNDGTVKFIRTEEELNALRWKR